MSEHTPGPWTVYKQPAGGHIHIHADGKIPFFGIAFMEMVNVSRKHQLIQEANATLMAAAPDLLEACEAMLANFSLDLWRKAAAEHGRVQPLEECIEVMTAAIAKARGQEAPDA